MSSALNLLLLLLVFFPLISAESFGLSYIVHMNKSAMPQSFNRTVEWYTCILRSIKAGTSTPEPQLLHVYTEAIQGFSATLSPAGEYIPFSRVHGFVAAYPDHIAALHTTYTPTFLSLTNVSGVWPASDYGDGVVVGIIDSGISPENPSFRDDGMGPVPSRWKGKCDVFDPDSYAPLCNRKLVGARSFNTKSIARDVNGHGTCTASVVAGNYVDGASFFGYAAGTSVGVAPRARVAAYNVVGDAGVALASDVLAGVDAAIADGVDVILIPMAILSVSEPLYQDPFAIAAYSANKRGIPVIFSAGNDGPYGYTVQSGFPWAVSVGASSVDRRFGGTLTLGNGLVIDGVSLFPAGALVVDLPLVYNETVSACNESMSLAGKIVVCSNVTDITCQMASIDRSDVAGAIFISDGVIYEEMGAFSCPGIMISSAEAKALIDYVKSDADPRANIEFQQTQLGASGRAPTVAAYSSRGPSYGMKNVLKPDLIAPGTRVLAAWPQTLPSAAVGLELNLSSTFIIRSGTSLASAHVAGVAALLKAAHPEWSPAAIRSAMMTTADPFDRHSGQPIRDDGKDYVLSGVAPVTNEAAAPLAMGSGHVDPNKALDPGLVYDIDEDDYIGFLCGSDLTEQQITVITGSENFACADAASGHAQLNYPSFVATFPWKNSSRAVHLSQELWRTVTNVGHGPAVYRPTVIQPEGYQVSVWPEKLEFKERNEKLGFAVYIEEGDGKDAAGGFSFGSLAWIDDEGKYVVRSPIVIIVEEPVLNPHPRPGICRPELCRVNC